MNKKIWNPEEEKEAEIKEYHRSSRGSCYSSPHTPHPYPNTQPFKQTPPADSHTDCQGI